MTGFLYDFQQTTPSPNERFRANLLKILKRRKSITPPVADGFLTTGTSADSAAEGDGTSTTGAPGATPGQN